MVYMNVIWLVFSIHCNTQQNASICVRAYCHHLLQGCYYLSLAVSSCWCEKGVKVKLLNSKLWKQFIGKTASVVFDWPSYSVAQSPGCVQALILSFSKQFDRMQFVIKSVPRLHSLIDHQLCRIQMMKESVRDSEIIRHCAGLSIVCQGGLFINGTPLWLICTKHPPPLVLCKASLCATECLI